MKTELLAPAKDKNTAIEAINCGADAVYIGASCFGARQNACNSLNDVTEVVNYAHKYWVKVFVTVNTILDDNELEQAVELIKNLEKVGVDAVLIQDMGLLKKLMELHLSIPIHASTQCDNREIEKITFFNNIGISRVVLARELSLSQIKQIHEQNPNIELEAFVHGALCVSYSGQCYLSEYIGGRSANRGECAQPCRKKYTILDDKGNVIKKDTYALCLKDFNASKSIKDMIYNGVYSFKIEGRLKDAGYVKNVVAYYRRELDKYSEKSSSGKSFISLEPCLEKSFNRGFTEYFLNGRTDCFNPVSPKSRGNSIGTVISAKNNKILLKTDEVISSQDGLCFIQNNDLEGFLVNKAEKAEAGYYIFPNKKLNIKKCTEIYRNFDVKFEKQLSLSVKRQIGIKVEIDKKIKIVDEDGITLEIDMPSNEIAKNKEKMNETFIKQFSKTGDSDFYIEDIKVSNDIPFMSISEINHLRRTALDKLMQKRLSSYKREVQKPLNYAQYYKKEVDYKANIYNNDALEFYKKCGVKVTEFCPEKNLPERQIELMRTKHCIKYALNMCKSPQNIALKDEKGVVYPLKFDCKNCEMIVLSSKD